MCNLGVSLPWAMVRLNQCLKGIRIDLIIHVILLEVNINSTQKHYYANTFGKKNTKATIPFFLNQPVLK